METQTHFSRFPPSWISEQCRGASGLSHLWHEALSCTSKSPVSCSGRAALLRYACEETWETTQLQAPDSLSYNGSFGAKRSRKNDACIQIYYLPRKRVEQIWAKGLYGHFLQNKCLFNWDSLSRTRYYVERGFLNPVLGNNRLHVMGYTCKVTISHYSTEKMI